MFVGLSGTVGDHFVGAGECLYAAVSMGELDIRFGNLLAAFAQFLEEHLLSHSAASGISSGSDRREAFASTGPPLPVNPSVLSGGSPTEEERAC